MVAGHSKFSLQLTFKCKTILHDSTLQLIQNKGPHLDKNAVFYHYISMWWCTCNILQLSVLKWISKTCKNNVQILLSTKMYNFESSQAATFFFFISKFCTLDVETDQSVCRNCKSWNVLLPMYFVWSDNSNWSNPS